MTHNANAKAVEQVVNINSDDVTASKSYTRPELTEEDLQAVDNLNVIWQTYKKVNNVTQVQFVKKLDWSQGNFSQYLTGKVPLGMKATISLADALDCDPGDIRPELRSEKLMKLNKEMVSHLQDATKLLPKDDPKAKMLKKQIKQTLSSGYMMVV